MQDRGFVDWKLKKKSILALMQNGIILEYPGGEKRKISSGITNIDKMDIEIGLMGDDIIIRFTVRKNDPIVERLEKGLEFLPMVPAPKTFVYDGMTTIEKQG